MSSSKAKKEKKKLERNRNLCELDDFCSENKLEKEHITEYQIRIRGEKGMVDVYPTSRKYCVLLDKGAKASKWGVYFKIEDLLKYL